MDDLKKTLHEMRAHLQDLDNSQNMTVREVDGVKAEVRDLGATADKMSTTVQRMEKGLDGLRNSVVLGHAATTALGGTFASLEQILEKLVTEGASTRQQLSDLTRRVEQLEKKAG
ncbi:MAG: hypothetical protein HY319_04715 [Armatimonadetes bacterium]|nr:hypothetical protein [Armatimonadota bacterium]